MCGADCFLFCFPLHVGPLCVSCFMIAISLLSIGVLNFIPYSGVSMAYDIVQLYLVLVIITFIITSYGIIISSRALISIATILCIAAFVYWAYLVIPSFLSKSEMNCIGLRCGETNWLIPRKWKNNENNESNLIKFSKSSRISEEPVTEHYNFFDVIKQKFFGIFDRSENSVEQKTLGQGYLKYTNINKKINRHIHNLKIQNARRKLKQNIAKHIDNIQKALLKILTNLNNIDETGGEIQDLCTAIINELENEKLSLNPDFNINNTTPVDNTSKLNKDVPQTSNHDDISLKLCSIIMNTIKCLNNRFERKLIDGKCSNDITILNEHFNKFIETLETKSILITLDSRSLSKLVVFLNIIYDNLNYNKILSKRNIRYYDENEFRQDRGDMNEDTYYNNMNYDENELDSYYFKDSSTKHNAIDRTVNILHDKQYRENVDYNVTDLQELSTVKTPARCSLNVQSNNSLIFFTRTWSIVLAFLYLMLWLFTISLMILYCANFKYHCNSTSNLQETLDRRYHVYYNS